MKEFLVELFVSKTNCAAVAIEAERLDRAAAKVTAEGTPGRERRRFVDRPRPPLPSRLTVDDRFGENARVH
jgi:hypothetical protein